MKEMNSIMLFLKQYRTLFAQLAFTLLAFAAMFVLSYLFMRSTVRNTILNNAESTLDATEERITLTFQEFETTLNIAAAEIQGMLLHGEDAQAVQEYITEISHFSFLDGNQESDIQDFFGYFEGLPDGSILLHSSNWTTPTNQPEAQEWYRLALEADGKTIETIPYISDSNETFYTYAKCIYDEEGRRLGVICMNVKIDFLGEHVIDTALNQDGYGMLINQKGLVMFHLNPDFRGIYVQDPAIPLSKFSEDIAQGKGVYEQPMISFRDNEVIVFVRTLYNGWHLGLLTPKAQYYETITTLGIILCAIAAIFVVVLSGILIRLDKARLRSDEESRQKSSFLANMSHEIRTPINAIVGMTAIGRASGVAERKDYCFSKINDASRHLLGVINDVLDISKIEANKIELYFADFHFEKMLQQVVNVVNFRVDEKNQKLRVYIDKNIPRALFGDDQRLAQIITNLLSNAVKFTPDGGSIELRTQLISDVGDECVIQIEVSDDGIGISPDQQEKLFQSFQQAESSTSRKYGGTGLGLAISKRIVELMGGKIWVESKLGQGAKFVFTIKVKHGNDTKYGLSYQNINWSNIRILTVDDDQAILEYFHEIAKGFGTDCEIASNADEALRLIDANGEFNIYFVDLKMPDVDGIALTKEIRAREKKPGTSIVIMISSADLGNIEEDARKAGVDKFLLKPIFPSSLSDIISECIGIANEKTNDSSSDLNGIFSGRHVLLAEDIDINREIVITLLKSTGIHIDCAENGTQAVHMFLREPEQYDMILMDVQMPEMDGYEATRQIRALDMPRAKEIPIVAMTANVFKDDINKCLAAGMSSHLGKPLDIDVLIRVMRECFAV